MVKYKLIKEYPGSFVKIGEEVCKCISTNEYMLIKYDSPRISREIVENYPEFWEKVIEKDYEILSFQHKTENIFEVVYNNNYSNKTFENYNIYSIKRLSDGEVFTIGDKCKWNGNGCSDTGIITKFEIKNDGLYASNSRCNFHIKWVKRLKSLFTTEDRVDLFDNDSYWWTCSKAFAECPPYTVSEECKARIHEENEDWGDGVKIFSTKEAAEKYIEENKPKYSEIDMITFANQESSMYVDLESLNNWKKIHGRN